MVTPTSRTRVVAHRGSTGCALPAAISATATSIAFGTLQDTSEFSNCIVANCLSLTVFGQTVLAQDASTLTWPVPAHVRYVKGPLAGVGSYAVSGTGESPSATSLDISSDFEIPMLAGSHLDFLLKAAQANKLSLETFLAEVSRRGVLSESVDTDEEAVRVREQGPALGDLLAHEPGEEGED